MRFSATVHNQAVKLMVAKALKIRHLIDEAMVSSNYEVVVPCAGDAFTAAEMEDAFKSRGVTRRGTSSVLCFTSLSLRRFEKVQGEVHATTLVKSDVGLNTLLEDLGLSADATNTRMSNSSKSA